MGWYEAIKDGIAVAQQADNVPLVRELIDAQKQILDLVDENHKLKEQIKEMQTTADIAGRLNDTTMHISRFLMILINAYTARVAGTRKEYWCKGKKRVWEHIVAHPAEQMRIMTKRPTINTRRKPLPALGT